MTYACKLTLTWFWVLPNHFFKHYEVRIMMMMYMHKMILCYDDDVHAHNDDDVHAQNDIVNPKLMYTL
jgi:hypothetical protein